MVQRLNREMELSLAEDFNLSWVSCLAIVLERKLAKMMEHYLLLKLEQI